MENVRVYRAADGAILMADFIGREYKMGHIWVKVYNGEEYINSRRQGSDLEDA